MKSQFIAALVYSMFTLNLLSLGVPFHHALFAPGLSSYSNVTIDLNSPKSNDKEDLSWQLAIQKVWENLTQAQREGRFGVGNTNVLYMNTFV